MISVVKAAMLSATLNQTDDWQPGDPLPPLWHWIYFNPIEPLCEAGQDGHPEKGHFLPPVDLPRRMWAGGQLIFHQPLVMGEAVRRVSTIRDIRFKTGRSGPLAFVEVAHEMRGDKGGFITEIQDLVYREAPSPHPASTASSPDDNQEGSQAQHAQVPVHPSVPTTHADQQASEQQLARSITPDAVLLFRYSALTFNSHRIHYDRPYCLHEEHYPGLVVHGPLTATLLANLCQNTHSGRQMKTFAFRGLSPLFDGRPIELHAQWNDNKASLWAESDVGHKAMQASATF